MRKSLLLPATTLLLAAQTATVPQFYTSIALPGDKSRHTAIVIIDPPLTLTSDASGRAHLGVSLPDAFSRCLFDANGNMTCKQYPQIVVLVKDEIPLPVLDGNFFWTLAQSPISGTLSCVRNGVAQNIGTDYTASGPRITSQSWVSGDTITCTYSYRGQ